MSYDDAIIVTCPVCGVSWDLDMDPPKCENDDHPQTIEVIMTGVPI